MSRLYRRHYKRSEATSSGAWWLCKFYTVLFALYSYEVATLRNDKMGAKKA